MDVREKLVELLNKANSACVGTDCFEGCKFYMENDCLYKLMADVMIENGVTVQEWISVKDMLPEKDGLYIVTACDEGCSCGEGIWYDTVVLEAEHYKGEWSWNENGTEYDISDFVTHWQPMPQPPKGE